MMKLEEVLSLVPVWDEFRRAFENVDGIPEAREWEVEDLTRFSTRVADLVEVVIVARPSSSRVVEKLLSERLLSERD